MLRKRKCLKKTESLFMFKRFFTKGDSARTVGRRLLDTAIVMGGILQNGYTTLGYGYSRLWKGKTSLYIALAASRELWLEDPFFAANEKMPMILRQDLK